MFKRKQTYQEAIEENKLKIKQAVRELDKETFNLEFQEKKLQQEIRKAAQKGDKDIATIHAKSILRNRASLRRLSRTKAQLQSLGLKLQTIKSFEAMSGAIASSNKVLSKLNKNLDIPKIRDIMAQFSKETSKLDMKQEMMEDMLDQAFEVSDEEEETKNTVDRIFTEMNLKFANDKLQVGVGDVAGKNTSHDEIAQMQEQLK